MQYLTNEDLAYFGEQTESKMNMIIFGMTSMMDATNDRVHQLESQTWYQRMANTITGKNKMTVNEIANNRDKINMYLSEAISCLYNQNKINQDIILSLGNRLNELYAQQIEMKQMIGAFVTELNQKIISVDNFHMLTEEINQGVYNSDNKIVSICLIASKLDARTIHDSRKMDILLRAMEQNGLLSDEDILFKDFLLELLTASESDIGIIAMMFQNAKEDYTTEIALDTLCQYYLLPEKVRKMKNKKAVIESVLTANQIDLDSQISIKDYYEDLMECLTDSILIVETQAEEEKFQQQYDDFFEYIDAAEDFFAFIKKMLESWKIGEGELYSRTAREDYCQRLKDMKTFVLGTSMAGKQFYSTLSNIDSFIQNLIVLLPKEKFTERWNTASSEWLNITADGLIESDGKYFTISEQVKSHWAKYMTDNNDYFSALTEDRINANNAEDYDNIAQLSEMFNDSYITGFLLNDGAVYFSVLGDYLEEYVEGPSRQYEALFSLCEKYPISFDIDEYEEMIREKNDNEPYISFEYSDISGKHNDCFNTSFWMSGDYLTVIIHFNNMKKLGTIHYSILENSGIESDSNLNFNEYEKFNVSWGDWVGNHSCEINFQKLTSKLASFKVKVWADCDPDCVGIIEGM